MRGPQHAGNGRTPLRESCDELPGGWEVAGGDPVGGVLYPDSVGGIIPVGI